jgi:hypothetical protein
MVLSARRTTCGPEVEDDMAVRMSGRLFALAAGMLPVLALSACGGTAGDTGVASAAGGAAGASASAAPSASASSDPLKFAQCMREHGIDMADPETGGKVQIRIKSADKTKLEGAQKACGKYMQGGGPFGGKSDPKARDALLKFAQCMREHGVNMPDPQPGQNGFMFRKGQGVDPESPTFKTAQKACEKYMPGAGGLAPSAG